MDLICAVLPALLCWPNWQFRFDAYRSWSDLILGGCHDPAELKRGRMKSWQVEAVLAKRTLWAD